MSQVIVELLYFQSLLSLYEKGSGANLNQRYPKWACLSISKNENWEIPLWLSRLRTQSGLWEDAGSTPGLDQWVKGPAWLQAAA